MHQFFLELPSRQTKNHGVSSRDDRKRRSINHRRKDNGGVSFQGAIWERQALRERNRKQKKKMGMKEKFRRAERKIPGVKATNIGRSFCHRFHLVSRRATHPSLCSLSLSLSLFLFSAAYVKPVFFPAKILSIRRGRRKGTVEGWGGRKSGEKARWKRGKRCKENKQRETERVRGKEREREEELSL